MDDRAGACGMLLAYMLLDGGRLMMMVVVMNFDFVVDDDNA